MLYCTSEEVMAMTKVNAKKLGFTESEFQSTLIDWIEQAENFINTYCKKEWEADKVPPAVKNVCIRLTSYIIAFHYKRREDPIRKVNDNQVKVFESDVFTDDLKKDLRPFRKASKISVFKI
ncbi:MAG: hypothetical protein IJ104_04265 [Methanobrevibacter sp.]|nr:hypothetical protein [Methanobrevibacter sp.]